MLLIKNKSLLFILDNFQIINAFWGLILENLVTIWKTCKINSRIQFGSNRWEVFVKSRQNVRKYLWRTLFWNKAVNWNFFKFLENEILHRYFHRILQVFKDFLWVSQTYKSSKIRSKNTEDVLVKNIAKSSILDVVGASGYSEYYHSPRVTVQIRCPGSTKTL